MSLHRLLIAHLEGTRDISTLAINTTLSLGVSINLDAAEESGIEVADELLEMAEYVIVDGQSTQDSTPPSSCGNAAGRAHGGRCRFPG